MPSGKTHDTITFWSLPIVIIFTFGLTQNVYSTLLVAGGFLFSGLMFGPDLDLRSQQYERWGVLRWIWLPYLHLLKHRSIYSHGAIFGTVIRVLYLSFWIALFAIVGILSNAIVQQYFGTASDWRNAAQPLLMTAWQLGVEFMQQTWDKCLALAIGLELGSISHSLSDWIGSDLKRKKRSRKR